MNWGKGIVIGMVSFMGFIVFMVVNMMRHSADLVSEDYYQQELNYNAHYAAEQVYQKTPEKIEVTISETELRLLLPQVYTNDSLHIELKRPNNEKIDLSFHVAGNQLIQLPVRSMEKGNYDLSIKGTANKADFLFQQAIQIR